MSTETVPEIDVDMTREVPCEHPKGCSNVAAWLATTTCCRQSWTICDPCRRGLLAEIRGWAGCVGKCQGCGAVIAADNIFQWRPL